ARHTTHSLLPYSTLSRSQDRFAVQWGRPVPPRRRKSPPVRREGGGCPSRFVSLPAGAQVPEGQLSEPLLEPRLGKIRPQCQRFEIGRAHVEVQSQSNILC